jgi:anaerobic magnesium-protoporphyrin IX monomethyl ester cyclase
MTIIIGGPHCTFHPDKALDDIPDADISVEGEGEHIIKQVMKSIINKKGLSKISGIRFRKNGKMETGTPYKVIKDLDSLPFPSRHLVERYVYGTLNNINFYKPKFTALMTSRGCPFSCRFCSRHISTMKTFRGRSVKNVINEFKKINETYDSVLVVDDNFLCDTKRANKILDGIIDLELKLDIYIQGARVDTADRKLYRKMKKAGVKHIFFGIESGNQDVLDFYNKKITLDQIRKAVNLSHEMNFFTIGSFILGAPIETKNHLYNTIKFSCSLPLDIALFHPLSYDYGSDLWNEAVKQGKISNDNHRSIIADRNKGLSNFTKEELIEFCTYAMKRYYYRPRLVLRIILSSIVRKDFSLIKVIIGYI